MKAWLPNLHEKAAAPARPAVPVRAAASLTRGHLNDLTKALGQQMFFWGRDVLHATGNLLIRHGFEKHESPGLKGTSCYRKAWAGGVIELHGACAGWYPLRPESGIGFLFVRTDRRCYAHQEVQPAIPGQYDYDRLVSGDLSLLEPAGRLFSEWLVHYESWVCQECGARHRQECHAMLSRLPAGQPWLSPELALEWLRLFAQGSSVPRAHALRGQQRELRHLPQRSHG